MKTEYKRENRMNVGLSIYPVVMLQVVDEMKWAVMYTGYMILLRNFDQSDE
jgi:hypothetical protein